MVIWYRMIIDIEKTFLSKINGNSTKRIICFLENGRHVKINNNKKILQDCIDESYSFKTIFTSSMKCKVPTTMNVPRRYANASSYGWTILFSLMCNLIKKNFLINS